MYILLYYSLALSCHVPTAHNHATNGARDSSRVVMSLLHTTTRRMPRQQGLESRLGPKVRVFLLDMYILLYYSLALSCHVPTAHNHATNGARDSSRIATSLLRTTTRRMPRREATRQIKTERASAEQQGQGQCTGGSRRVSKLRYVFKKNVFCVF
jgi:hypothetical protein